jgi:hypothetical protein
MDSDEQEVLWYLKSWHGQYVSALEIARRASHKRRFQEEPQWAVPVLQRLVDKAMIESDANGHYRIPCEQAEKKKRCWVAPHLRSVLLNSGKDFGDIIDISDEDIEPLPYKPASE